MVTPAENVCAVDLRHAGCDDSSDRIFVEGEVTAGKAACLMPRRYRKQPDWWVVEVVAVDAPTEQAQGFRLTCPTDGLWGTQGIEVVDQAAVSRRIPRPASTPTVEPVESTNAADPGHNAPAGKLGGRILRSGDEAADR